MRRVVLSPSWLARHVFVVACVAAFCFLGLWQWHRAMAWSGGLQNLAYAFQWWTFAGLVILGWGKLLRDDVKAQRRRDAQPDGDTAGDGSVPAGAAIVVPDGAEVYRAPTVEAQLAMAGGGGEPDDAALDEYNRYLAWLNANPRR